MKATRALSGGPAPDQASCQEAADRGEVVRKADEVVAVGVHHEQDAVVSAAVAGEEGAAAVRRPPQGPDFGVVVGQSDDVGAVGVHHEQFAVVSAAVAGEENAAAVGRPGAGPVMGLVVGQLGDVGTVGVHHEHFAVCAAVVGEEDAAAVRGPALRDVGGGVGRQLVLAGTAAASSDMSATTAARRPGFRAEGRLRLGRAPAARGRRSVMTCL